MPRFASYDGTEIGYSLQGDGPPLVCLSGGPGRAVEYLGDLGGVDSSRQLVLLHPRGVGWSDVPVDPATYRVDRLVSDVESLRLHLGLDQMDLLAHSAGSVLATLYAAAYPQHVSRMVLVTPGLAAVGVYAVEEEMGAALHRLGGETWFAEALAAWKKIIAGDLSAETFCASRPLFYGRWDEAAQAHATVGVSERGMPARVGYFADVAFDAAAVRLGLKRLHAPVLLYAGDRDPLVTPAMVRRAAPLLNDAAVIVQSEAAHFPWVDQPGVFAAATGAFLD